MRNKLIYQKRLSFYSSCSIFPSRESKESNKFKIGLCFLESEETIYKKQKHKDTIYLSEAKRSRDNRKTIPITEFSPI